MQSAKETDGKVSVGLRSQRASGRHNGNGTMPETWIRPSRRPRRFGILSLLTGETIVETHTSEGGPAIIRIPHTLLAVIATIALALVAGGFWLVSSITEMKTNLATIQQTQRDIKAQQSSGLKLMVAYATNETSRVNFMTGLLAPHQRREVYEWDRANPRPQLPETNDSPDEERNP